MTPLRGADGEVYAMAQGSMVVSGFGISGKDGSRISLNVPSSGRVPNGATVEREVTSHYASDGYVMLNLNTPDFTTAARLGAAINKLLGEGSAQALDAVSVRVKGPVDPTARVAFVGALQELEVNPGDAPARVIAHRHGRDRLARAGDARGRRARLTLGDHHRAHGCQPAQGVLARRHHGDYAALGDLDLAAYRRAHVPVHRGRRSR
jgi:hypothetical protein